MKHFLLLLFLATSFLAYSQSTATDTGFLITTAGDTLRGQITIRRSEQNPTWLDFSDGVSTRRYSPHEVSYIRLNEIGSYRGAIVTVDRSPSAVGDFEDPRFFKGTVTDTVFLTVVLRGKLSLYKLVDDLSKIHYYVDQSGELTELTYRTTLLEVNGVAYLKRLAIYRQQLMNIMKGCSQAEPWVANVEYNEASLSLLVLQYNSCTKELSSTVEKRSRTRFLFGALVGYTFPQLSSTGISPSPPVQSTYESEPRPQFGLFAELRLGKAQRKLSVITDLSLKGVSFQSDNTKPPGIYRYELDYVRISAAGRWYMGSKWAPYLQAGFGLGYAYRISYSFGPYNLPAPVAIDPGLHAATGLKYKRVDVHFRYDYSTGLSQNIGWKARVSTAMVAVLFRLNKDQ